MLYNNNGRYILNIKFSFIKNKLKKKRKTNNFLFSRLFY